MSINLKYHLLTLIMALCSISGSLAQKRYTSTSGEFIFSFADITDPGKNIEVLPRFTGFYHLNQQWSFDLNRWTGIYSGLSIRNIGYVFKEDEIKTKRRSYSLGVPLALKLGSMEKFLFLYAGTELELLFHYKEKVFDGNQKTKSSEWLSNKTNLLVPSLFAGVQLPAGINLKFKWYMREFMNREYHYFNGTSNVYPYENLSTQIYYISMSIQIKPSLYREWLKPGEVYAVK
jgi:hypothetical protein